MRVGMKVAGNHKHGFKLGEIVKIHKKKNTADVLFYVNNEIVENIAEKDLYLNTKQ